ncbi:hypothetical protein PPSIR1_00997 [Plesiocystis pacifica SIR-1]|uniref:Lipoprotein n=1 Tax=Plesiocystis pacifica SIR-1 TaxID=391625 RepID=A6GCD3_9BACT|nr:hypothetical protein [Plesiocystis pacifica]EDM76492.1 hypothetical protein PPSIR1_00997 [Plesiocystis pacifica SIR-1]
MTKLPMTKLPLVIATLALTPLACADASGDDEGSCAFDAASEVADGVFRTCADLSEDLTSLAYLGSITGPDINNLTFEAEPNPNYRFGIGYVTNESDDSDNPLLLKLKEIDSSGNATGAIVKKTVSSDNKIWIAFGTSMDSILVQYSGDEGKNYSDLGSTTKIAEGNPLGNSITLNCTGIERLNDCVAGAPGCPCRDSDSCDDANLECNAGLCMASGDCSATNKGFGCECQATSECDSGLECIYNACQEDKRAIRSYVSVYENRTITITNASESTSAPTYHLWYALLFDGVTGTYAGDTGDSDEYRSPYLLCPSDYDSNYDWRSSGVVIRPNETASYILPENAIFVGFSEDEESTPDSDRRSVRVADTTQPVVRFERLEGCAAAAGTDSASRLAGIPFAPTRTADDQLYLVNCGPDDVQLYDQSDTSIATIAAGGMAQVINTENECEQVTYWFADTDDPTLIVKKKTDDCG